MKRYIVSGYDYSELDDHSKCRVKNWLDEDPFDFFEDFVVGVEAGSGEHG